MSTSRRTAFAFLGAAIASAAAAAALVPRASVIAPADAGPALALETQFPPTFGGWTIDPTVVPLAISAELRQVVEAAYDQTLARTYVNAQGYRVMLSVAYGGRRNQGMDVHRPEVCYPAQGLALRSDTHEVAFALGHANEPGNAHPPSALTLKRLVAGVGSRNEPISYWLVIGASVASFGYGHRLALLKYGLTGHVPDGMLIRISSIDADNAAAFAEQDAFLRELLASLNPVFRRRVLGRG